MLVKKRREKKSDDFTILINRWPDSGVCGVPLSSDDFLMGLFRPLSSLHNPHPRLALPPLGKALQPDTSAMSFKERIGVLSKDVERVTA